MRGPHFLFHSCMIARYVGAQIGFEGEREAMNGPISKKTRLSKRDKKASAG